MADLYKEADITPSGNDRTDLYKEAKMVPTQPPMTGIPGLGEMVTRGIPQVPPAGVSAAMGVAKDIQQLQEFMRRRTAPLAPAVPPAMRMQPLFPTPIELQKEPYPRLAETTAALAPAAIPFPGAAEEAAGTLIGSQLAKIAPEAAARLTGSAAAKAGFGAGYATGISKVFDEDDPEERMKDTAVYGALLNTIPEGALRAIPFGGRSLVKYYRKLADEGGMTPTPDEAQALLNTFNNDVISFGDLVKAPKLRGFYHSVLKWVPFTGVMSKQKKALFRLEGDAGSLYGKILGDGNDVNSVNARKEIQQEITDIAHNNYQEISPKYSLLDTEADNRNIGISNTNAKKIAGENLLEDMASRRRGFGGTLDSTTRADLARFLQIPGKFDERTGIMPVRWGGQDITDYLPPDTINELTQTQLLKPLPAEAEAPFKTARTAISNFRNKSETAYNTGNLNKGRIYKNISDALQEDIQDSLDKGGAQDLYSQSQQLSKEYKEKVVPFYHPDKVGMRNLIKNQLNLNKPGALENVLTDTTNEEAMEQLPQDLKNKIAARLMSNNIKDDGDYTVTRLLDAYKKLSPDYEKKFLDDETRAQFDNLSKRAELLDPVLKKMKNRVWRHLYHAKFISYSMGVPFFAGMYYLRSSLPKLYLPMVGLGRALSSDWLKRAYITGEIPSEEALRRTAKIISRPAISAAAMRGPREQMGD